MNKNFIVKNRFYSLFILILFTFTSLQSEIPNFQNVKETILKSDSRLLDRKGRILQEFRTNPKERRLDWISINEISTHLIKSIVQAEDKRFYEHSGVDWIALFSGVLSVFSSEPVRGASTITMQLVSFLEDELKPKGKRRSIGQKFSQIFSAKELESKWSKNEILEAYLNLVTFRGELIGVDSASRGLFQKQAHALSEIESLMLASLVKIPSSQPDRIIQRACYIAKANSSTLLCEDIKNFIHETLLRKYFIRPEYTLAPHLGKKLLQKSSPTIDTTLDREIQLYALETIEKQFADLSKRNVRDVSLIVLQNQTGEILSYVGSSGKFSKSQEIDGVVSLRQAGSTLKPFIYAQGIEKKFITGATILEDAPFQVQVGGGIYNPSNYQEKFFGFVTARNALASSLNVPAIKVLDYIGIENFSEVLSKLEFQSLRDSDYYGLSIALGSIDVSLWQLVKSYHMLANKGVAIEISYLPNHEKKERRIFSEQSTFIISNILSDRQARALSFGLENPLSTKYKTSVKTGTSKDMRDNWCIGYSEYYTVGVWVGNFSGEPMWNVSGVTGAATIWSDMMTYLHKDIPYKEPELPDMIVKKKVYFKNNNFSYDEYFIKGTEVERPIEVSSYPVNVIKNPLKQSIFAIDPEIPSSRQRISFETTLSLPKHVLVLDKKVLGATTQPILWKPEQGKHKLELKNDEGKIIDEVEFYVR
ncbi:MAG: penicillin-binding protein 1C [Leptospiraceae bacterium]|nr:penicillin-binding protein 1C [Leptospiraceae bacterium]